MGADFSGKNVRWPGRRNRTLFFDLLPLDLGEIRGFRERARRCVVRDEIDRAPSLTIALAHRTGRTLALDLGSDSPER